MARHIVKTTFLLISCLITAGLLSFMLISDTWISINIQKLDLIEKKFENEFQIFTGQKKLEEITQPSVLSNFKSNKIIKTTPQTTVITVKSTTSAATTIPTTTSKASITNFNENDQDTNHDGGAELENEETDESDSTNNNNNNNNNNHDDSDNLDYEQEESSNNKRLKRADEQGKKNLLINSIK